MGVSHQYLEVWNYTDEGYKPLVLSENWKGVMLNWEPLFDLDNLGEIECHNQTDEVFVLWKGSAALFVSANGGIMVKDLEPGVIYNVPKGIWHNLVATRDASFIIVENRDTHLHDTEIRTMDTSEIADLKTKLPAWAQAD